MELDRLYLLAGPKEEFEESDHSLEQVCMSSATKLPNNTRSAKAQHSSVNVDVLILHRTLRKLSSKQNNNVWLMLN